MDPPLDPSGPGSEMIEVHGFRVVALGEITPGFRSALGRLARRGFADPACTVVKTAQGWSATGRGRTRMAAPPCGLQAGPGGAGMPQDRSPTPVAPRSAGLGLRITRRAPASCSRRRSRQSRSTS
jgi:hypothetical protein